MAKTINLHDIAKNRILTTDKIVFEEGHVEKEGMELYRWKSAIQPLRKWGFNITNNLDGSHDCAIPDNWTVRVINDGLAVIANGHGREIARIVAKDGAVELHTITPVVFYVRVVEKIHDSKDVVKCFVVYDRNNLDVPIYTTDGAVIRNTSGMSTKKRKVVEKENRHKMNELRAMAMDYVRSTELYS